MGDLGGVPGNSPSNNIIGGVTTPEPIGDSVGDPIGGVNMPEPIGDPIGGVLGSSRGSGSSAPDMGGVRMPSSLPRRRCPFFLLFFFIDGVSGPFSSPDIGGVKPPPGGAMSSSDGPELGVSEELHPVAPAAGKQQPKKK